LNIERFEIGQSYVTAKVQNRYGDKVTINIQGGRTRYNFYDTKKQQYPTNTLLLL
jgi:uncharacterized protein Veg